jgi:4-coumarate--CoA ligase
MISGTTGKMKGVQFTHLNLVQNLLQYRCPIPYATNANSSEIFFPQYRPIHGLTTVVLLEMLVGNRSLGIPAFDFEFFCEQMSKHKVTRAHIVPPVALLLASSKVSDKYDISSLKYIAIVTASLMHALQSRLKAGLLNPTVLQGYSLSECSPSESLL